MSMRRIVAVLTCLLLVTMGANAASRSNIQIKVLGSETRAVANDDNNGVPANCEQLTFDAYCRSTRATPLVNTLLVQEGDGVPFRISCRAESKYSKCVPLPKGESYEARKEKKGFTVYYVDDKGKLKSQLYMVVAEGKDDAAKAAAASAAAASGASGSAAPGAVGDAVQPAAAKAAPAADGNAVQPAAQTSGVVATEESSTVPQTVKCSFTSTPAGAEVTVDGRYVGSTPSVVGVTTGPHVVVISMAGFALWKRELTVEPGSELTVNAVLQKSP